MKVLILMGSPRHGGNTAELYDHFFLDRDPQGRVYRMTQPQPDPRELGI